MGQAVKGHYSRWVRLLRGDWKWIKIKETLAPPLPLDCTDFNVLHIGISSLPYPNMRNRSTVKGHATGSESAKSLYYSRSLLSSVRESYGPTDYHMLARLGWWNETAFPSWRSTIDVVEGSTDDGRSSYSDWWLWFSACLLLYVVVGNCLLSFTF